MSERMTVKQLKEFIASIPEEHDERKIYYVDFDGWSEPTAVIEDDGRVVIQ